MDRRCVDRDAVLIRLSGEQVPSHVGVSFARSILDCSTDCIKVIELDGTLSYMNQNGRCAMEIADFDALKGVEWVSLWPAENRHLVANAVEAARAGDASRFEAECPTAGGKARWWDVSVSPVYGLDGSVESIVSISRDITGRVTREAEISALLADRERLLGETDILMREVDHRVKNSLAMVASLLNLQAGAATDETARDQIRIAARRVITVSRIHGKLYSEGVGSVALDAYLRDLCEDLTCSVSVAALTVNVDQEETQIPADQAVPLGLIVAELVSNAARHGGDQVTIAIDWHRQSDGSGLLTVTDDGPGFGPDGPPDAGGLGLKIVAGNARKLRASIDVGSSEAGGARISLTVPALEVC